MAVVPLTAAQQQAADAMVAAQDFRKVNADEARARDFLAQAKTALTDVPVVTQIENRYNLSYKAAHDVGEAMLCAYGYKNRWGTGAHERIARFLSAIFDTPPASEAAQHFEIMRSDRNNNHYRALPVTRAAADLAAEAAQVLFDAASARLTASP